MRRILFIFWIFSSTVNGQNIFDNLPAMVDVGVNGIYFSNVSSVKEIVGENLKILDYSENVHSNHMNFINADSTEVLILLMHEGSNKYEFHEIIVKYKEESFEEECVKFPNSNNFITYKGISLGASLSDFKKKMGNNFEEIRSKSNLILKYEIKSNSQESYADTFLKYYNMPAYYGEYTFQNNKLICMKFGFPYP